LITQPSLISFQLIRQVASGRYKMPVLESAEENCRATWSYDETKFIQKVFDYDWSVTNF